MADINKINVNGTTYNINLPDNSTVSGLTVTGTLTAPNISSTTITATTANLSVVKSSNNYEHDLSLYDVRIYTEPLNSPIGSSNNYVWFKDDYISIGRKTEGLTSGKSNRYYFPNTDMPGEDDMRENGVTYYKLVSQDDIKPLYLHTIAFQMNYATGGGASYKNYRFYGNLQIINYSNEAFTTSTLDSYISNIFKKNTHVALNVNGYMWYTYDQTAVKNDYGPVVRLTYNPGDNRYTVSFISNNVVNSDAYFTSISSVQDSVIEIS